MGAALCCYILVAPKEFTGEHKEAAYKKLAQYRAMSKELGKNMDPWEDDVENPEFQHWIDKHKEHDDMFEAWFDRVNGGIEDLMDFLQVDNAVVDEFLSVWADGSRDSSFRSLPGDKDKFIMVTGEMTWGDTPEGVAYQAVAGIHHYNLLDELCIE